MAILLGLNCSEKPHYLITREIFDHPDEFAKITGLPEALIRGFSTLWLALRVGLPLDPVKFKAKAKEVKDIFYAFVPWAHMCPTLHKILDHYHVLLSYMPKTLTVHMLSEEASEACNKDTKRFERERSRKFTPKQQLEDVFYRYSIYIRTVSS